MSMLETILPGQRRRSAPARLTVVAPLPADGAAPVDSSPAPGAGSGLVEWAPERDIRVAEDFTEFVETRSQALWRAAWLLTGDPALAEDLLQTALAKTWPHFARVSRTGSYEAYVRRTLFTTYASWWQRRWRGEIPTETLPEHSRGNPDRETSVDVRKALVLLSPKQRAVIVLRYFEDLTEAEVALELGCSVGSVKTHHSRAIARLRESGLLSRLGEGP